MLIIPFFQCLFECQLRLIPTGEVILFLSTPVQSVFSESQLRSDTPRGRYAGPRVRQFLQSEALQSFFVWLYSFCRITSVTHYYHFHFFKKKSSIILSVEEKVLTLQSQFGNEGQDSHSYTSFMRK